MSKTAAQVRAENAELRAKFVTLRSLLAAQEKAARRYPDVVPARTIPLVTVLNMLGAPHR